MADYLIHFNGRHDKKGRFTFGDGDGDGQTQERANRGRKVNRYQYASGDLTKAGERRFEYEKRTNLQKSKKNRVEEDALRDPSKWVRDDLKTGTELAKASKDAANATNVLMDDLFKTKPNQRLDLSKMSDKEIRDMINRETLERQYNTLFNPPQENKGKAYVKKALEVNNAVADVAIAGLTIAGLSIGLYKALNG